MQRLCRVEGGVKCYLEAPGCLVREDTRGCPFCDDDHALRLHGWYWRWALLPDPEKPRKLPVRRLYCAHARRTVSLLPDFCLPRRQHGPAILALFLKVFLAGGGLLQALRRVRRAAPCHAVAQSLRDGFFKRADKIRAYLAQRHRRAIEAPEQIPKDRRRPAELFFGLVAGFKGTMSEAELHVLKARLRGGILNKVRRGEYRCVLPTGLTYDEAGNVVLESDSQVRETIAYFFETFSRVGSANQTVRVFRNEGLPFPSRFRNGGETVFRPLTASTAIRTLNNPRYAGAYVYGRRRYRRAADGKKTIQRKRDCDDWLACIPNAQVGYITWERFQENLRILESNGRGYEMARASPPREGAALLQGCAVCGQCGRHFRVRYAARRGRLEAWYVCDRAHGTRGEPNCQSIAGWPIDEAIGELVTERMTPTAVELALEIRREIEARYQETDQLRCRAIERAQIEADQAQRRFMLVEPSNRLVADTLEGEWNDKLRALAKAREERERGRKEDQLVLDDAIRERLVAMTTDFQKLWADPGTPRRERKRLLAYIIEDVTLIKLPAEGTTNIHVRFKGGKTETLTALNPKSSAQQVKTSPKIVELVDKLLDDHIYSGIADLLNEQGLRSGGSARPGQGDARFTAKRVAYLVHRYGLRSRYDRLRDRGMLTKKEAAARLGIHEATLVSWAQHGIITRHAYNAHAYLYETPGPNPPAKHSSRWDRLSDRAAAIKTAKASKPSHPIEGDAV